MFHGTACSAAISKTMDSEVNEYGLCTFCGAKNVKSPKTGKVFCSQKCWNLKDEEKSRKISPDTDLRIEKMERALERFILMMEYLHPEINGWIEQKVWEQNEKYGESDYGRLSKKDEDAMI